MSCKFEDLQNYIFIEKSESYYWVLWFRISLEKGCKVGKLYEKSRFSSFACAYEYFSDCVSECAIN